MLFTTPTFVIFLAIVFPTYWLLEGRRQNQFILAASLVFYGWWNWRFLGVLLLSAGIDFLVALKLEETGDERRRTWLLRLSLFTNLGMLAVFKYANFFLETTSSLATRAGLGIAYSPLRILLPLGISFYTFQALSYTIDVYRRQLPATRDPVAYFGFITFFPHMVAGPIQRAVHLLVQFDNEREFSYERAADGCRQILWGVFKKLVIADNLAPLVNAAFAHPAGTSGSQLVWAAYAFTIQVYCDFSGYTDIAIGCARLFGFNLTRAFAYPYFALTITQLWLRWNMSLMEWFREYVFIPLGGSRLGRARTWLNLLVVFVLSGLWHGASWSFVAWGTFNGIMIIVTDAIGLDRWIRTRARPRPLTDFLLWVVTFQFMVTAAVMFRAGSLSTLATVLSRAGLAILTGSIVAPSSPGILLMMAGMMAFEWIQRHRQHALEIERWSPPFRLAAYYGVLGMIFWRANLGSAPFIYFQF